MRGERPGRPRGRAGPAGAACPSTIGGTPHDGIAVPGWQASIDRRQEGVRGRGGDHRHGSGDVARVSSARCGCRLSSGVPWKSRPERGSARPRGPARRHGGAVRLRERASPGTGDRRAGTSAPSRRTEATPASRIWHGQSRGPAAREARRDRTAAGVGRRQGLVKRGRGADVVQSRARRRAASSAQGVRPARSSPGWKRARVAVGIGSGARTRMLGPVRTVSAAQERARAIWAAFVAP